MIPRETMNTSIPGNTNMMLSRLSNGRRNSRFEKGQIIFSQGEKANSIFFIVSGTVKTTFLSETGKEAVLAVLGSQDFFGEECISSESMRINTATALTPATLVCIERQTVLRAIYDEPELSVSLMNALLMRQAAAVEDFCDQLFNQSEKRLARALLKLARNQKPDTLQDASISSVTHETLSEMIGTTRSRVTLFMNKFRRMGLIDYYGDPNAKGRFIIRKKLLSEQFMLS